MDDANSDWREVGDWKDGRVRSSARAMIWVSLIFGVTFTGFSLPAVLAIPSELDKGNTLALIALLFPLVGLGALAVFVHALIAWHKFSASEIVLDPVPGSIGGDFGGSVETRIRYRQDMVVNITLNCQHSRTTGSGKNRSTSVSTKWQRQGVAATRRLGRDGTEISFRFAIPEGLPQSESACDNYHHWSLQIECEQPGVDFNRSFSVPVFEAALPRLSSLDVPYAKDSDPLQVAPAGIVQISTHAGEIRFYYPWHRRWGTALLMTVLGSVFVVAGLFAGEKSGNFIFPLIFGGVGGLLVLIGLYMIGNTLCTRVSSNGVHSLRRIYGVPFRSRAAHRDISHLERSIGSQTQAGSSNTVFYRIRAHTRDGRKITIADSLQGSRLADFVEDEIRGALGPLAKD